MWRLFFFEGGEVCCVGNATYRTGKRPRGEKATTGWESDHEVERNAQKIWDYAR